MSQSTSAKPSKSRRICVVGAGRWGKNVVRTLSELGILGGVVELSEATRTALADSYPDVTVFETLDSAMAEAFDGFVVATPAHTHYEIAKRLLSGGFHVLVEKPITLFSARARELCTIADSRGVNIMVGHVLLFHPAIRQMQKLISGGKIGKLQYLYSNRLNLGTVRTEENILWSFAPHDISIFHYLIGAQPISVESRGGVWLQPKIHDTTMTLLRYPDNIVAHIFLSWLHPYKEHRLVVVGSKGMLSYEDSSTDKELKFYEKGIDWVHGEPQKREGPTEVIPYQQEAPLAAELSYFAEHLDGSPIEIASGQSGVEVLEVLERASVDLTGGASPSGPKDSFFVHPSAVVDEDVAIGAKTKIWHFCHVQSGARIGKASSLGQNVYVGGDVVIGNHVKIQNNVSVYQGVTLEDYVFCGPSMVFTNVKEPRSKYPVDGGDSYATTLVREGATLGANCTVVCGTTIGRHAFVAAGAVITKDVPDFALVQGVPAKRVGWMCECGERLAESDSEATCPDCNRSYRVESGTLRASP